MLRNILFLVVLFLLGCVHPIAENLRREADSSLTFAQLFQSPENYVGTKTILGGVIVKTTNLPEHAEIEVVHVSQPVLQFVVKIATGYQHQHYIMIHFNMQIYLLKKVFHYQLKQIQFHHQLI